MAVKNNFTTTDLYCIAHSNFTPSAIVSTVATDVNIDVAVTTGGTVLSVTFDPGDGSATVPLALDTGTTYDADVTYASAGTFLAKVTTILNENGETHTSYHRVTVT